MVKTKNVMRVRVGRFSCTLEGLDDPIRALQGITDHLRELSERHPAFAARMLGTEVAPSKASAVAAEAPPGPVADPARPTADLPPEVAGAARPEPAPLPLAGDSEGRDAGPAPDPAAPSGLQKLLTATPEGEEEEELSRILSRADDQLSDPEAARRRELIAQLKAAVAATEAERALGESGPGPQAREGAFRLDLRDAVQSQPPMPEGHHSPLKLVASQRVDLPLSSLDEAEVEPEDTQEADPAAAVPRHKGSFAAFATEMGAGSLLDLLEAAAAWLCFVDSAESVSRAQLLALASEALPEPPDREEGLRAFGVLLRQGRISPVAGGRYRVSAGSRFDPGRLAV